MRLIGILCIAFLALCAGCGPKPLSELTVVPRPGIDPSMFRRTHLAQADSVLAGTIVNVRDIGAAAESTVMAGLVVEPIEVTMEVDTVVKGAAQGLVAFRCHVFSKYSSKDLGCRRFVPEKGQRRLVFLKFDGRHQWRLFGDVFEYSILLRTGRPDEVVLKSDVTPVKAILKLLLVPTVAVDAERYCRTLGSSVDEAIRFDTIESVINVLRPVMSSTTNCIYEKVLEQVTVLNTADQRLYCEHSPEECKP